MVTYAYSTSKCYDLVVLFKCYLYIILAIVENAEKLLKIYLFSYSKDKKIWHALKKDRSLLGRH